MTTRCMAAAKNNFPTRLRTMQGFKGNPYRQCARNGELVTIMWAGQIHLCTQHAERLDRYGNINLYKNGMAERWPTAEMMQHARERLDALRGGA